MATTAPALQRFVELDFLRGFAVMGILALNIIAFSMPELAAISPAYYGGTQPADITAWFAAFVLFDGKMRGLFSLLFGASMMLIIARAEAKGGNPASVHYSRMIWLALFGLLHFFFIWFGDILFLYAAVGSIAFLLRAQPSETLIRWALGLYAAGFLIYLMPMGSVLVLQFAAQAPGASAATVASYKDAMTGFAIDPGTDVALYRGSYADITRAKFRDDAMTPLAGIVSNIFETLPLMLLGMALLKNGFLLGQGDAAMYRRWGLWGLGLGGICFVALGITAIASGFDPVVMFNIAMAWSVPPRLLMTIGYAALLILMVRRYSDSGLVIRIACAGRAAFTNYLGTSIVLTTIFYGYGLGLFGQVGRAECYLFVVMIWALMLLWSKPWLQRYRYGPLEWLWRSLARRKPQPMRLTPES